jgi:hypothetical protein
MDEYGRWAVLDTGQPFYHLMTSRYVDEDSAQAMADILNASGCSSAEKDKLWAIHDRVVRYAPMLERSKG